MPSAPSTASQPSTRRGRPAARAWSVEELAALLDVPPDLLHRALDLGKCGWLAGAFQHDGEWRIPERAVKALTTGRAPERFLSFESVAQMLDCSYHHAFRQLGRLGLVHEFTELGLKRVRERDVWKLCGLAMPN